MGTVHLHSSDKTTPVLALKNIRYPNEVKELIHRQVEEMKVSRRMRVGEILDHNFSDGEDEDILASDFE